MINRLKSYTALFIFDKTYENVILLERMNKKGDVSTLNGLLTGIGGHIDSDENLDIKSSVLRELEEETKIKRSDLSKISHPIATFQIVEGKPDLTANVFWFTAVIDKIPDELYCNEGKLKWYKCSEIKNYIVDKMTDSKYTLPWILKEKAYSSDKTKTALIDLKQKGMFVIEEGFFSPFENEE